MPETTSRSFRVGWLLLLVLLVGLVLRLVYLAEYSSLPDWYQLTVDNWYHHNWARALAFGEQLQHTTYFRAPFYTWCLAGLYLLFGASLWVGRLFGLAVGVTSILFTYLIGRRVGGSAIGLIAASLHALYPIAIYFESELLLDPLFTLLLQVALYQFLVWLDLPRVRYLLLCGLWLGLAAITRPTGLVLAPILIGIMLSRPVRSRLSGSQTLRGLAALVGATALVLAPLFIRNVVVAGDSVFISSQGGINLYIGSNETADGLSAALPEPFGSNWQIRQVTYTAEQAEGHLLTPGQVSGYWSREAWRWIADNPGRALGLFFRKLYFQFSNEEISNNRSLRTVWAQVAVLRYNPLGFGVIFALAVVGSLWGWRRSVPLQVLLLMLVAYGLTVSLFFFSSRFRLPLLPCYFVLAAVGVRGLLALACGDRRRLWGPLAVGGAATLFSVLPLVSPANRRAPQSEITQGLFYYAHNDFQTALTRFRQAAEVAPRYPEVNLNLGACYFRLGREDSARVCFEREIALHPRRHKAWQNLASLNLVNGRTAEAVDEARQAVALAPYDVTTQLILIRTAAADSAYSTEQLSQLGEAAARATGDDLEVLYESAVALSERLPASIAMKFLVKAIASRRPAIETDDRAFGSDFDYDGSAFRRKQAAAFSLLGYLLGRGRDWTGATLACRAALERDSLLVQAWVNLASALRAEGRLVEADSVALEAVRRFPTDPAARSLQGP